MKPKKISSLLLALLTILLFDSCVDEIVFDVPKEGGQLIVSGEITNGNRPHTITIARTSPSGGIPIPVTGAGVWIEDDQGNREQLVENYVRELGATLPTETIFGYTLVGNFVKGKVGSTYVLDVILQDGTTYQSEPDTMPSVLANDEVRFQVNIEEELTSGGVILDVNRVQVFLDSQLPNEPIYLKWDLEHVTTRFAQFPQRQITCYYSDYQNSQDFVLFDGGNLDMGLRLQNQKVGSKTINNDFYLINSLNVVQSSLSSSAFEYWEKVKEVTQNVGTIFDVPGGSPIGNIKNVNDATERVLGYFGAIARDTSNIVLSRLDFPDNPLRNPCQTFPNECNECYELNNGTIKKPSYWPN